MSDPRPRSQYPLDVQNRWGLATQGVRGGLERTPFDETTEPLFLTQGFVYPSAAQAEAAFAEEIDRFVYSRYGNPTVSLFEERLRIIEGAEAAFATASGMSALYTTLVAAVPPGGRIVAGRALFGSTFTVLNDILGPRGIETVYVDGRDLDQWRDALAGGADAVLFETPSNPMLELVDIQAVADLAHAVGATVIVDNVFATPVLSKPLKHGADVVVYSTTKHIDGQGRVLGGAILGAESFINGPVKTFIQNVGPTMSAFNAWILLKGLETLSLRVKAQTAAALELARWLEGHRCISAAYYPFLPSHPQYELAQRQSSGGGTVVSFDLVATGIESGDEDAETEALKDRTFTFLDALQLIDISNNLGDAKSLITHPATTTHRKLGKSGQKATGISQATVRLSVGLEDIADIKADIEQALAKAFAHT